ncbi:MAG: PQQ-binding-like beta-propeller repeat protein, partial [Clostridia bacterium]|nr:PQQ-binding-like beta-propeller repeat protein [Clostridia bacterium]
PSKLGLTGDIRVGSSDKDSYARESQLSFGRDVEYSAVPGVLTFGGNNYRNSFAYGSVSVTERRLREMYSHSIGALDGWTGTGWTGQPLIVCWPDEVRPWLGVADSFKQTAGFTEIIYPAMDGYIYFLELETGKKTRDPIATGVVLKGTACLDPRGYPLLYVGQGIPVENDKGNPTAYVRVYSLITNQEIASFGGYDYFSNRTGWQAYDSSPMLSNDTLVYGGENGVLYTVRLNASFDPGTGALSVNPEDLVKMRYTGTGYSRNDGEGSRWYGIESSVSAFRSYAYFTDNGGRLMCVDLNSMTLKFAVDVTDESDASVVIEESYDDNTIYLYTGSQVKISNGDLGAGYGYSYHRKINGLTGAVVWEKKWPCSTGDSSTSGGTLATAHAGRGQISHLVIYSMSFAALSGTDGSAETPDPEGGGTASAETMPAPLADGSYSLGGRIVAYDKTLGTIAWSVEQTNDYWSSPVVVYDEYGKAYLIQCDRGGIVTMYDASTGTLITTVDLGSRIDSTPAVYNNMLVVGTRGKGGSGESQKICCVKISSRAPGSPAAAGSFRSTWGRRQNCRRPLQIVKKTWWRERPQPVVPPMPSAGADRLFGAVLWAFRRPETHGAGAPLL